uniref:Uncharacterized protein n=1 Tax=Arion vulgaris TaxID=1028688 RepID=A0A0B6ZCS3_9EUPU
MSYNPLTCHEAMFTKLFGLVKQLVLFGRYVGACMPAEPCLHHDQSPLTDFHY